MLFILHIIQFQTDGQLYNPQIVDRFNHVSSVEWVQDRNIKLSTVRFTRESLDIRKKFMLLYNDKKYLPQVFWILEHIILHPFVS